MGRKTKALKKAGFSSLSAKFMARKAHGKKTKKKRQDKK